MDRSPLIPFTVRADRRFAAVIFSAALVAIFLALAGFLRSKVTPTVAQQDQAIATFTRWLSCHPGLELDHMAGAAAVLRVPAEWSLLTTRERLTDTDTAGKVWQDACEDADYPTTMACGVWLRDVDGRAIASWFPGSGVELR